MLKIGSTWKGVNLLEQQLILIHLKWRRVTKSELHVRSLKRIFSWVDATQNKNEMTVCKPSYLNKALFNSIVEIFATRLYFFYLFGDFYSSWRVFPKMVDQFLARLVQFSSLFSPLCFGFNLRGLRRKKEAYIPLSLDDLHEQNSFIVLQLQYMIYTKLLEK